MKFAIGLFLAGPRATMILSNIIIIYGIPRNFKMRLYLTGRLRTTRVIRRFLLWLSDHIAEDKILAWLYPGDMVIEFSEATP